MKIYENLNFLFVLSYILLLEFSQVTFFHNVAYNFYVNFVLGSIAIILVLRDFFSGNLQKNFNKNYNWMLLMFMAVCLVSMALNFRYGFKRNVLSMFGIFSNFYFMYNFLSREKSTKKFRILLDVLTDVWIIPILSAVIMYVFQISFSIKVDDSFFQQGFAEQRLFGLFMNINVAAVISVLVVIYKIFRIAGCKSKIYKFFV